MKRQIVALGGGGFSRTHPDPKMCAYILSLTGRKNPKVCIIPTASGDDPRSIENFYRSARRLGAKPSHLSLFQPPTEPLTRFVLRHDAIWVGGGNTLNLLLLWKAWGLDAALRAAYERGVVLSGSSAGALCWFASGVTDSFPGRYQELSCLGWLGGSFCPHYDSEPKRRPVYRRLVGAKILPSGYAAEDNVGLHFLGEQIQHIVASKRDRCAYRLIRRAASARQTKQEPDIVL